MVPIQTMASSTEQKELALVSKVELRIALSDSDAKLEAILNTYLPPLLLKLASEHAAVRNKASHDSDFRSLPYCLAVSMDNIAERPTLAHRPEQDCTDQISKTNTQNAPA